MDCQQEPRSLGIDPPIFTANQVDETREVFGLLLTKTVKKIDWLLKAEGEGLVMHPSLKSHYYNFTSEELSERLLREKARLLK